MAGFRNLLVHEYDDIDLGILEQVATERVVDLVAFADAITARL